MHKSIIFLLGFLVFLLPFGTSSMSNSNALASEEYRYEEADQYENYATDMANDNYYKSQGNDFIKKIKCNNINSNLNGLEATIGTDDLLGIGAGESLQERDDASANAYGYGEGYNGNFDLDCINNNNNAGGGQTGGEGTGTVGPRGPQGPQGPSGITQINEDNYYSVIGDIGVISTTSISSTAECEQGDVALSGEYSLFGLPTVAIFSSSGTPPESWFTTISGTPGQGVTTTVNCFDNSP
jgi:hypothetical protein